MEISNVVAINISRSTAQVDQAGFSRLHIMGRSGKFTDYTARLYTSLTGVVADFAITDPEYLRAQAYFAQNPKPVDLLISQTPAPQKQIDVVTVSDLAIATYTVTINGVACSKTYSGAPADKDTVVTDLKTAIEAANPALPVVCTLTGSTPNKTLTLTAAAEGTGFTASVSAHLSIAHPTPNISCVTAMIALMAAGYTNWFGLMFGFDSAPDAEAIAMAAWIEAQEAKKLFGCSVIDPDALDPESTTDLAYLLQPYAWTFGFYDDGTNEGDMVAAFFGKNLTALPGSNNWAYKTLASQTASVLTDSEVAALEDKSCNYYVEVAGVSITRLGTVADGEWIDVLVGVAWLQSIMQQDVFALLVSVPKIPFTDAGITQVCNTLLADLKQAVSRDVLASYVLPIPKASDYTATQKGTRILDGLTFTGVLAGAVNKVTVNGTVTF